MLMRVKPITFIPFEKKPGKDEHITFFKPCTRNCPNCDTKRMTGCKK